MGVKKYMATADNTITNAFKFNLTTRGTGSNMGAADILEVFHIYAQANSSSSENERVIIQFPISDITTNRTENKCFERDSIFITGNILQCVLITIY